MLRNTILSSVAGIALQGLQFGNGLFVRFSR